MTSTLILAVAALVVLATSAFAAEPLKLHPDNPHYLLFRGKPAVLITSGEHYGAVMNLDFDYVKYLDELAGKGLNLTRTFSGTYHEVPGSFDITDNTLSPSRYVGPWARTSTPGAVDGGNKFDLAKWDDAYFARLKDFVTQAGKRGIVVEFVLFCTIYNDQLWDVSPLNAKNNVSGIGACPRKEVFTLQHKDLQDVQEAFVRKALAELKDFDNVYYEICNEPYWEVVTPQWSDRIAEVIAQTESAFPARHLIAQNIANGSKKVDKPNPNVAILNYHYCTPPDAVEQNWAHDRVLGDDETGFRGNADVTYRSEGWEFIIAGGATYSSLDYSFTPAHPAGDLRDYKSPGGGSPELRKQLGILRKFVEGFDLVHMKPSNALVKGGTVTAELTGTPAHAATVTVRCLAEAGKAYAIYIHGGTHIEISVDLPAGGYKAEWLNTRTGEIDKAESFDHGGGTRKVVSPDYTEDIALAIRKQ